MSVALWRLFPRITRICGKVSKETHPRQYCRVAALGLRIHSKNHTTYLLEQSHVAVVGLRPFHLSTKHSRPVIPFKLSDIGEGIKEVTIKEWFVKEGDQVNQFDQICEVQSDKASVTITSRYDGTIKKVHYAIDEIALVGNPLVDIEVDVSERSSEGEQVIQEGDAIQVGRLSPEESFSLPGATAGSFEKALATPAVRRIATEYKIELKNVQGTGKEGRVLKEDLLNHINAKQGEMGKLSVARPSEMPNLVKTSATSAAGQPKASSSQPSSSSRVTPQPLTLRKRNVAMENDRTEAIKGYTRTMIKTMTTANEIPHFGYSDEIIVTELMLIRKRLKEVADKYNIKLTMLPFIMKSASLALAQYPILNATLDLPNNSIIYKAAHNIGIAMDTNQGLIVPNVKNVESKSILEIASDLQSLHKSAISGSVNPGDLRGGTFSISNIGSIGGTYAHPVILPPEVAIIALGKIQTLPRFSTSGIVVPVQVVNASFSCDHRVIDGATAARFSNLWKSYIEDPSTMLLHLQ